MKLPLWIKDKQGKWHPFPYDLLKTYAGGRVGFDAYDMINDPRWWDILDPNKTDLDRYLEYNISIDRYYLKEES